MVEVDKQVIDLQKSVQNYLYTGYDSLAERVLLQLEELGEELVKDQDELLTNDKALDYLQRMRGHLKTYRDTFNFAVEEREKRKKLVLELKERLVGFQNTLLHESIQKVLMRSEKNLYEYLQDPDILKVNHSLAEINEQIALVSNENLKNLLSAYKANFIEIVQSTRGFLFLVSVVMAGEAHEFAYVSNLLKDLVVTQVEPLKQNVNDQSLNIQKTLTFATATLFLFAIILSIFISRSINSPLMKLTTTFNLLAKGSEVDSVPGLDLKDEIGEMSQAAEVFRQKNKETIDLVNQLDEKKADLERSNDELDQFVYTVSHDLKSPIVTSMGFIGMMKDLAEQGKYGAVLKKLPTLEKANRRMNQLISDLLELSRVERVQDDVSKVNMTQIAHEVIKLHQAEVKKQGITAEVIGELPQLEINESRALQLLDNLFSNAVKYCQNENGPKITIGCQERAGRVLLFVKDNGPGIAKEYHEKVFNLFQRLQSDKQGTGIGLAIVQKIMKSQGGNVRIESGEGVEGCTFWLEFPIAKDEGKVA